MKHFALYLSLLIATTGMNTQAADIAEPTLSLEDEKLPPLQPENASPAPAAEAADTIKPDQTKAGAAEKQASEGYEAIFGEGNWNGSLMFRSDEVQNLIAVYRAYQANMAKAQPDAVGEQDNEALTNELVNKLSMQNQEQVKDEVLNFSLNSIIFHNEADWSIWINGIRYFGKDAMEGIAIDRSTIRVLKANEREVVFEWTPIPQTYNKVLAAWEAKERMKENESSPQIVSGNKVKLDSKEAIVTITMRPHQSFMSQYMSVMEGRFIPVPVTAAEGEMKQAAPAIINDDGYTGKENLEETAPPPPPELSDGKGISKEDQNLLESIQKTYKTLESPR